MPTLLVYTRYWRSSEDASTGEPLPALGRLDRFFLDNGYAVVKADARGSGASFGSRPTEYGKQEICDVWDILEWIVGQHWSDGSVGAYGTSYTGTTAELVAAVEHPALKSVIPGWSEFDDYLSRSRPYGLVASSFIRAGGDYVGWQDENNVEKYRLTRTVPSSPISRRWTPRGGVATSPRVACAPSIASPGPTPASVTTGRCTRSSKRTPCP